MIDVILVFFPVKIISQFIRVFQFFFTPINILWAFGIKGFLKCRKQQKQSGIKSNLIDESVQAHLI
jgi:hypothetical protein